MKPRESLSRCATSTRLEKSPSIFMFYINATSTKLKHNPRRGYNVVELIDKYFHSNLVEVA